MLADLEARREEAAKDWALKLDGELPGNYFYFCSQLCFFSCLTSSPAQATLALSS